MATKSETILAALAAALTGGTDASVERNSSLPSVVPTDGLMILRDGEPGEPEFTMSPPTWHYEHLAEMEVYCRSDAEFDALKIEIGTAIAADRTLGGLCDWIEAEAPLVEPLPIEGAAPIKAGRIGIRLHYATNDPLS